MSDLDSIKSEPKAKRILRKVHFNFKGAHLAYTDGSQGGAASLKNESYLFKANDEDLKLTEEQEDILNELGEEPTPLDKTLSEVGNKDTHSSLSEDGEDKLENIEEDQMSTGISKEAVERLEQQIAELTKANAVIKAQSLLKKYEFDEELEIGVADAMASVKQESADIIIKALDVVTARIDEAVSKAKEEAVEKSAEKEENPLAKALEEEAGHDEAVETVEKSLAERITQKRKELEGAK